MRFHQPYRSFRGNPVTRPTGKVVRILLYANIGMFFLQAMSRSSFLVQYFAFWPDRAVFGGQVWQFVTYAFLHGDVMHILFNMLLLYWFGRDIESRLGSERFAWFYLGAVIAGAALHCAFYLNWPRPMMGASGAIMGIIVMYGVLWPNRTVLFMFFLPMRMRTLVVLLVLMDLYSAVSTPHGSVASLAHLGGAAYGYFYLRLYPAWIQAKQRWQAGRNHSLRQQRERDETRLDEVLDKVHQHGMHTLTGAEQRFLKRMSQTRNRG